MARFQFAPRDDRSSESQPKRAENDRDTRFQKLGVSHRFPAQVRVVDRRDGGVVLRGAKVHQTGTLNSHWLVVMPGQRLAKEDADYAITAAVPVDAPGLRYVLGRAEKE